MFYKTYRNIFNVLSIFFHIILFQLNASNFSVPDHLMKELDAIDDTPQDIWAKNKNINLSPLIQFAKTRNIDVSNLILQDLDFFNLTKENINGLENMTNPKMAKKFLKAAYSKIFEFRAYAEKARFLSQIPRSDKDEYVGIIIQVLNELAANAGIVGKLIEQKIPIDELTCTAKEKPDMLKILPHNILSLLEGIDIIFSLKFKSKKSCSVM